MTRCLPLPKLEEMKKVNRGPRKQVDLSTVSRLAVLRISRHKLIRRIKSVINLTSRHISHADVIGTENDSLDRSSATRIDNPLAESQHYGINRALTSGDATTNCIHQRIIDIQNLRHPPITDAVSQTLNIQTNDMRNQNRREEQEPASLSQPYSKWAPGATRCAVSRNEYCYNHFLLCLNPRTDI
ncbi:hypothetical protein Tco_0475484, partial [Tanacetum coccineum]